MRFQTCNYLRLYLMQSKPVSGWILILLVILSLFIFTACGGGGSDDKANQINGTATNGDPIQGEVRLRDAQGKERSAVIGSEGGFSMDTAGLIRPYLIWAESSITGDRFYGVADFQGQANLTPAGNAAVAMAIGIDPALYYDSFPSASPPSAAEVADAAHRLTRTLSPAYPALDIEPDFEFLHTPFAVNNDDKGFDRLLQLISVTISDPVLQLSNEVSGVIFFSCDLLTGASSGWQSEEALSTIILEDDCSVDFKNWYVYSLMEDIYLWQDEMQKVNPDDYDSPEALLDDMMVQSKDHFSFIGPADEVGLFLEEGVYLGLGIKIMVDWNGDLRLGLVYAGSPADGAGLSRGDRIRTINGVDTSVNPVAAWGELDFTGPGQTVQMTVETLEGDVMETTIASGWVTTNPVFYNDVVNLPDRRVGYLVFNDFLQKAVDDIDAVFLDFKDQGIDELVLDLRYNTGGSPDVAIQLASWIAGNKVGGDDVFANMIHNESYAEADRTLFFEPNENAPALERVVIITTSQTASASEMLINGLAPFMEVILVGDTTYGKPVGMYVFDLCDKLFMPVTFKMVNALGEGGYFDGIPPDCPAEDDLFHAWGDPNEASLGAALYYLQNGTCPPQGPMGRMAAGSGGFDLKLRGFRRLIGGF